MYGEAAENACSAFQRTVSIQDTGHYGKPTHDALLRTMAAGKHEWAWDAKSVELYTEYKAPAPAGKGRDAAMSHMEKRLGYTEQPANSNCDSRPDGIRTAQDHTRRRRHLAPQRALVRLLVLLRPRNRRGREDRLAPGVGRVDRGCARGKAKCYRGWTTDRSKVKKGDLVVIGGYGVHVEMVRGFSGSNTLTYGGNTSPGSSGSQSNGGGAYERTRKLERGARLRAGEVSR